MTYKEKVEYLKSYRDKTDRLIFINNQIEGVQGIKYTPNTNSPKKSINAYIEEKTAIQSELESIEECINSIDCEKCRYVVAYRFLHLKTLEQITDIMNYSHSQVYRYYKQGIEAINSSTGTNHG